MSVFFSKNKYKYNIINTSYKKIKINNLFLNYKFIIYISLSLKNIFFFKNKILNYNLLSITLEKKYIKALFNFLNFSFLIHNNYLCIFINDNTKFIEIIKILENQQFNYSYKNCFSNLVSSLHILEEYNKYNINYIYIQFILKKIKIKILFLFLFFLISLVKYIK
jgi:hypothetical protein